MTQGLGLIHLPDLSVTPSSNACVTQGLSPWLWPWEQLEMLALSKPHLGDMNRMLAEL